MSRVTLSFADLAYLALACLVAAVCATGCSKKEAEPEAAPAMPDPVGEAETRRGQEACRAYKLQVCACAARKPGDAELKNLCELAPAKLSSLEMVLRVNRSPENADERVKTSHTARRIMASCISEQSKLTGMGCVPGAAAEKPAAEKPATTKPAPPPPSVAPTP